MRESCDEEQERARERTLTTRERGERDRADRERWAWGYRDAGRKNCGRKADVPELVAPVQQGLNLVIVLDQVTGQICNGAHS